MLNAISFEEATRIVLHWADPLPSETIRVTEAAGRVLASNVVSSEDVPPFANSAMDGFAVKSTDTERASRADPVVLAVIGKLHAGDWPDQTLSSGEAIQIMTGAPLPTGADTVVPVEKTELGGGKVKIFTHASQGDHCRSAGDDVKAGDTVFPAGRLLDAYDIGVLASIGQSRVETIRLPSIAIVATGDELTPLEQPLQQGKIRASSTYALAAQLRSLGCPVTDLGLIPDDPDKIRSAIREAFNCDIILTTGGVSMGEHDYVRDALTEVGVDVKFWKVRQKPGKPLVFGVSGRRLFFGLPGNPVSTMIGCKLYVEPAVRRMAGQTLHHPTLLRATLAGDLKKKAGLTQFVRGRVFLEKGRYHVRVLPKQSSGVMSSLAESNGLIVAPENAETIVDGDEVQVALIRPMEGILEGQD